jgi:hypothetical protein
MGSERGAPLAALRSRQLRPRRSNCESARGSDADRHDKVLIYLAFERSHFDAYSQFGAAMLAIGSAQICAMDIWGVWVRGPVRWINLAQPVRPGRAYHDRWEGACRER